MRARWGKCGLLLSMVLVIVIYYLQSPFQIRHENASKEGNLTKIVSSQITVKNPGYLSVCHNITMRPGECQRYQVSERKENRTYPLQVVSGAPGSGNDWILWLASLSGYTLSRLDLLKKCEVYARKAEYAGENGNMRHTNCLFLKSHEPWFNRSAFEISELPVRATLLLRHPYDAAFADYKRHMVFLSEASSEKERKQTSTGLKVNQFYDLSTNTTKQAFINSRLGYLRSWLRHARYWLTEYERPLHILLYNSVRGNTAMEVENMQRFFGYQFDGKIFRRHCCLMRHPINPHLKRKPSDADVYKEIIYKQEEGLYHKFEQATAEINKLLAYNYPGKNYTCTRG